MSDGTANLILALATENAELRVALAEAQVLLVEIADEAGNHVLTVPFSDTVLDADGLN